MAETAAELSTVTEVLTITQGSVYHRTLTVWTYLEDPDTGAITKTRADLTGANIWLAFWDNDSELSVTRETDTSEIQTLAQSGSTLGQATLKFIASDTETLDPNKFYQWEVHVQLAGGTREPVINRSQAIIKDRLLGSFV